MPSTQSDLIEELIESLRRSVTLQEPDGVFGRAQRDLDTQRAKSAIDLFIDKLNDLPPNWLATRDHLQNAVIGHKLFDKDDDVQLFINSDPSEYIVTAAINLGAGSAPIKAGGDTPEIALQKLRTKLDKLFNIARDSQA